MLGYTGATEPRCEGNRIGAVEGEAGTGLRHGGCLGVEVARGMTGQVRRPRVGRREGGQAGRPGRNSLPFVGKVLGHGRTYEEGGEDRRAETGNSPRPPTGYTRTGQAPRGGGSPFYHDVPPHFQVKPYQAHRPNMSSLQVDSGGQRWFVVYCRNLL